MCRTVNEISFSMYTGQKIVQFSPSSKCVRYNRHIDHKDAMCHPQCSADEAWYWLKCVLRSG